MRNKTNKKIFISILIVAIIIGLSLYSYLIKKNNIHEYYNVIFDVNGSNNFIPNQKVVKNGLASRPIENPQKDGYIFIGWYKNLDDKEEFDFNETVKSDITLRAKWEKENNTNLNEKKYYKITFNSNGGSKIISQEVKEGESVKRPNNPTKKGYTFVYWQIDGKEYDFSKPVKSNLTLISKWKKNNKESNSSSDSNETEEINNNEKVYKINYHIQNAASIGKETEECTINSSGVCTITTPKIIAKSDYAVIGWTTNKESFDIINTNERYTIFSDTDLYALTINLNELNLYVSLNGKDTNSGLTKSYSVATIQKAINNLNEIAKKIGNKTIENAIIRIDKGTYVNQNANFNYSEGINIKRIKVMGVRENGKNLTTFIENNSKPNYSPSKFMSISLPSKTINLCSSGNNLPKCSYGSPVDESPTFKIWYLNVEGYTNGIMAARLHDSDIAYVFFNQIGNEYTKTGAGYGAIDLTYSNNNTIRYCKFTNIMNGYYYCEKTKSDGSKNTYIVDDESKCVSTSSVKATLNSAGPWGLHAIYLAYNSNNNKITNSEFTNIKASPIKARDYSKNNVAQNNIFTNAGYHGYFHISVQTKKTESGQTIITENSSTGNIFKNNTLNGPFIDKIMCEKYAKYIKVPNIIAKTGDSSDVTESSNTLKYDVSDGKNTCKSLGITIN